MHEEKVKLGKVVDEESLVAGRHHVAGLLVGTVTDLYKSNDSSVFLLLACFHNSPVHPDLIHDKPLAIVAVLILLLRVDWTVGRDWSLGDSAPWA